MLVMVANPKPIVAKRKPKPIGQIKRWRTPGKPRRVAVLREKYGLKFLTLGRQLSKRHSQQGLLRVRQKAVPLEIGVQLLPLLESKKEILA